MASIHIFWSSQIRNAKFQKGAFAPIKPHDTYRAHNFRDIGEFPGVGNVHKVSVHNISVQNVSVHQAALQNMATQPEGEQCVGDQNRKRASQETVQ